MSSVKQESEKFVCFDCDSTNTHREQRDVVFMHGVDAEAVQIAANIPVIVCDDCKEEVVPGEAEVIQHDAVCTHLGLLTPREIRALREKRGLTQVELADLVRCGEASIKRWELGLSLPNGTYDMVLRELVDDEEYEHLKTRRAAIRTRMARVRRGTAAIAAHI